MNLQIYRTFKWEFVPGEPIRLGGTNSMRLVHTDELQMEVDGAWVPVPVVEAPKPEHPQKKKDREDRNRMHASIQDTIKNMKKE